MIDQSAIEVLRQDFDDVLLGTVVTVFLQQSPQGIVKIRAAFVSGDHKSLEIESYSLKSSAAILGAMTVSALCAEIEAHSKNPESFQIELDGWISDLEREFQIAASELAPLCA